MTPKTRSISLLVISLVFAMSLWFISAAVLSDMAREFDISPFRQAAMSSAVPFGFVLGALLSAFSGIADRFDPRRVFALSVVCASLSGFALLWVTPGGTMSIAARALTGFSLAGVYPVGMKIAVGWGETDRGLLVGLLVGALTIGSASPHLVSLFGGAEWRWTIATVSGLCGGSALLVLFTSLGPFHSRAKNFRPSAIREAWSDRRIRGAYFGYFGHMWELYAMWSWIGIATLASYKLSMSTEDALAFSKLTAFSAIGIGGITCVIGGKFADNIGKANVAMASMVVSGLCAVTASFAFGSNPAIVFVIALVWGAFIIPDSPQFSALVADVAPKDLTGSLLTLQTAIGFALTILVVQSVPWFVEKTSWETTLLMMALGPAFGVWSVWRNRSEE